jgi:hypothetical protein
LASAVKQVPDARFKIHPMGIEIDWSTATVSPEAETLQLVVELTEEPDTFWTNEFTRIRGQPRELVPAFHVSSMPSSWSKEITVYGLEPGSEDEVRRALDGMIEETNHAAAEARRAWDVKEQKDSRDAELREQAAAEMTERFRSPPG